MRCWCVIVVAFGLASMLARADDRPNVVLILADDLGINDLHCYGRADHATPRLDRLAAEGARFTSAYAGLSICSASRAAIMTGKAPARLHLTTFLPGRPDAPSQKLKHPDIAMQLPLEETTLAERFKGLGYATAISGKWHLGNGAFGPIAQGFDEAFLPPTDSEPSATEGGKNEYAITRRAVEFIERKKDGPFFLYVPHHTPHIRLAAKFELVAKHKDAFHPVYAAMIETLDDVVGQVLDTLDRLDLAKKTIVIFASDNGGLHVFEGGTVPTHNTPFRAGKGFVYEGGLRVPLIVRWPGHIPAAVIDDPTVNMDFTPTLMELCGGHVPTDVDGRSIAGRLRGGPADASRSFAFHFPHYTNQGSTPGGAIREGEWKLVERYEESKAELYNLASDPGEKIDLADREPARVRDLGAKLDAWRMSVGAQINGPNPDFDPSLAAPIYRDFDATRIPSFPTAARAEAFFKPWRALMNAAIQKRPSTKK